MAKYGDSLSRACPTGLFVGEAWVDGRGNRKKKEKKQENT